MGLQSTWFCRCGKLNKVSSLKCESCGLARTLGERKDADLSKIAKQPPRR